jgi:hypothetical protein
MLAAGSRSCSIIQAIPASITISTTTLAGLDNQCDYSTVLVALSQLVTTQQKLSMLSSPKTLLERRLHRECYQTSRQEIKAWRASATDTLAALLTTSNSAPGPDLISGKLLRRLAPVITRPLATIFQASLEQGCFPSAWKQAIVVPIYKSAGPKTSPSSYRPVSLCSTLGKALEHIVRDQLMVTIQAKGGLSKVQHGFSAKRSTMTNLLVTENIIADALNNHQPLDIVSVDFSRAVDKVPHDKLLQELAKRGVTGKKLQWIRNFLHHRTQSVRMMTLSSPAPVTSRVIHGSVLGPSLFIIYIDTLLRELDIPAAAYADDLKLMGNLAHVTVQDVQRNIYKIAQWSEVKGMPLSVAKCAVMHYGSNNPRHPYVVHGTEALPAVDHFKDLGVVRAEDGTFNDHVATMTSKGRRLAGLCRRKLVSRNPAFMMKVFNTYVLPSMLYASSVWSPRLRYELNALETIQRQYTRRIVGLRHMCYGERLHTMQLSIESTFMSSDLVLAYKLLHGKPQLSVQ